MNLMLLSNNDERLSLYPVYYDGTQGPIMKSSKMNMVGPRARFARNPMAMVFALIRSVTISVSIEHVKL